MKRALVILFLSVSVCRGQITVNPVNTLMLTNAFNNLLNIITNALNYRIGTNSNGIARYFMPGRLTNDATMQSNYWSAVNVFASNLYLPGTGTNGLLVLQAEGLVTNLFGTADQYVRGDATLQILNTTVVPEGDNLYFTTNRVHEAATNVYEPVISAGTTEQYWRGDKSWQILTNAVATYINWRLTQYNVFSGPSNLFSNPLYNPGAGSDGFVISTNGGQLMTVAIAGGTTNVEPPIVPGTTNQVFIGDKSWEDFEALYDWQWNWYLGSNNVWTGSQTISNVIVLDDGGLYHSYSPGYADSSDEGKIYLRDMGQTDAWQVYPLPNAYMIRADGGLYISRNAEFYDNGSAWAWRRDDTNHLALLYEQGGAHQFWSADIGENPITWIKALELTPYIVDAQLPLFSRTNTFLATNLNSYVTIGTNETASPYKFKIHTTNQAQYIIGDGRHQYYPHTLFATTTPGDADFEFWMDADNSYIGSTTDDGFRIMGNLGAEVRLGIDNTGNVGIGQAPSYYKLIVPGVIGMSGSESDTLDMGTQEAVVANYLLMGYNNNWGLRQGTDHGINFDVYNSGTELVALSLSQSGVATIASHIIGGGNLTLGENTMITNLGSIYINPAGHAVWLEGQTAPNTDNSYHLGAPEYRWKDIYGNGDLHLGENAMITNAGYIYINPASHAIWLEGQTAPNTDGSYDLGAIDYKWKDIYGNGNLRLGTSAVITNEDSLVLTPSGQVVYIRAIMAPLTDGAYDLGSSAYRWKDIYGTGDLYLGVSAVITNADSLSLTPAGQVVYMRAIAAPLVTANYDLGTSDYRWKDIYGSGNLYLGQDAIITNANSITFRPAGQALWSRAAIYPEIDQSYDLGQYGYNFRDLWIYRYIYMTNYAAGLLQLNDDKKVETRNAEWPWESITNAPDFALQSNLITVSNNVETVAGNLTTVSNNVETVVGNLTIVSNNVESVIGNLTIVSNNVETVIGNLTIVSNTVQTTIGNLTIVSNNVNTVESNLTTVSNSVVNHVEDTDNPHSVTYTQVGAEPAFSKGDLGVVEGAGLSYSGTATSRLVSAGTLSFGVASGRIIPTEDSTNEWDTAYTHSLIVDGSNPHATATNSIPGLTNQIITVDGRITTHIGDSGNPHSVTYVQTGAEAALGNPGVDNYVLSSTTAGVRSWVAQSGGVSGSGTVGTIPIWSGSTELGDSVLLFDVENINPGITETYSLGSLTNRFNYIIGREIFTDTLFGDVSGGHGGFLIDLYSDFFFGGSAILTNAIQAGDYKSSDGTSGWDTNTATITVKDGLVTAWTEPSAASGLSGSISDDTIPLGTGTATLEDSCIVQIALGVDVASGLVLENANTPDIATVAGGYSDAQRRLILKGTPLELTTWGANVAVVLDDDVGTSFTGPIILDTGAPASNTSAGTTGEMRWDASYLYICTSGGAEGAATWKRIALVGDTWP